MNGLKWWLHAATLSIIIAMLLSLFVQLDPQSIGEKSSQMVFRDQHVQLTGHNLVDQIGGLDLLHQLRRVDWTGKALFIDIKLQGSYRTDEIYDDLFTLCMFSFVQTENVQQLLVRMLDGNGGLVLALDGSREQWDRSKAKLGSNIEFNRYDFLNEHFRIVK